MSTNKKLITFLDTIGRNIIGEEAEEQKEGYLAVKNPVIVHIVPNPQTNQMSLQLFPVFFKEFQADKDEDTVWFYKKDNIVESNNITLDFKLQAQYTNMFSKIIVPDNTIVTPESEEPLTQKPQGKVVKLFDD